VSGMGGRGSRRSATRSDKGKGSQAEALVLLLGPATSESPTSSPAGESGSRRRPRAGCWAAGGVKVESPSHLGGCCDYRENPRNALRPLGGSPRREDLRQLKWCEPALLDVPSKRERLEPRTRLPQALPREVRCLMCRAGPSGSQRRQLRQRRSRRTPRIRSTARACSRPG
jgi:hypothetical protein